MFLDGTSRRVSFLLLAPALFIITSAFPRAQAPAVPPAQAGTTPAVAAEPAKIPGLAGTIEVASASDPAKAEALLADVRKALGGADKLKSVQRLEIKGKSARSMGTSAVEGDFEVQMEMPDKFNRRETLAISNDRGFVIDIHQVMNGAIALQKVDAASGGESSWNWEENNRGGRSSNNRGRGNFDVSRLLGISPEGLDPRAREEAEHAAIASQMARIAAALLAVTSEPMAWIGTAKSHDGKANVLEFKTPDGVVNHLLVDDKRHLPVMISWTGIPTQLGNNYRGSSSRGNSSRGSGNRSASNAKAPLQLYFSDYKTINGIKLPHLLQGGANDETTEELVVKTYRVNPVFKDNTFAVDK
jgi:hypothetical protein